MYCDQEREIRRAVLQYSHCTYDTALGAGQRAGRAAGARGAQQARGARSRRAGRAAGARARRGLAGERVGTMGARALGAGGRAAGPAGYALSAFSLFWARFDSVLFLIQFLDIIREPGS